ncbi:MAG: thiamine diphosphokinase [Anaerolineae bacterium]|nr:thiamine diphosphokinase [Thermoflexales bacterium]MDW8407555.1 thiamine diphosphokinase [Anaerolineae bacterium]
MRTVIIANGDPPGAEDVQRWLHPGDRLICADGGARAALALGLTPHAVVGDFDSLTERELATLAERGATLHRYSPRKDETDLELALLHAVAGLPDETDQSARAEIVILGALGGRLDQTIANVMLLAMPALAGARVWIARGNEACFLVTPDRPALLHGAAGDVVSLIPFGGDAHGVRTTGLEYPLCDESLFFGPARGVSNVLLGEHGEVCVREGRLLCIHTTGSVSSEKQGGG